MERITFSRDGITLVGNLYFPADFDSSKQYGAVIVQGSATSVKEQMGAVYGPKLAAKGFIALAFDYSHYGESEGEPRQLEDFHEKKRDLIAAVDYLSSLPYVKDVFMLGICTSGGTMSYLASSDPRLKAAAAVAGFFTDPEFTKGMFGEEVYDARLKASDDAATKYAETGEETILTCYSETDPTAVNYIPVAGALDYYFNPKRGAVPEWKNEMNVMSFRPFYAECDVFEQAKGIKCPVIVVHSDGCTFPQEAKKFYDTLTCEKQLAWGGGGTHFDYYDQPAQVDYSVAQVSDFFKSHSA